jgi:uncharacterized protein YecE (DUF72 family)
MRFRIGTAGWSIASQYADAFPRAGSGLERYAARLPCVEINSSFYRSHRPATWTRWGDSVPAEFRFAAKMPRAITHERSLRGCDELVAAWLQEISGLGSKLAVLLVQLPPRLAFDPDTARAFFAPLASATSARIVCEPRHASWFDAGPDTLLDHLKVARVAADPARVPAAAKPGGWRGFAYWRLHGSPVIYRSAYGAARLEACAATIRREAPAGGETWCIFDNTAAMAAIGDAFLLEECLSAKAAK